MLPTSSRAVVAVAAGADNDWVRLDVTGDGPGLAVADRERIFERLTLPLEPR